MVADPNDPNCCQAPQCSNVTAGVQGSITGSGHPPTVNSKYRIVDFIYSTPSHFLYVRMSFSTHDLVRLATLTSEVLVMISLTKLCTASILMSSNNKNAGKRYP